MTTFLLVRHGRTDLTNDVLLGRSDPVGLSQDGKAQIHRLGFFMSRHKVDLIQTSPRRRCRETASELALALNAAVEDAEALDEVDFGDWTGCRFDELAGNPLWQEWNEHRDGTRPPNGERMREVQIRIVRHMQCLAAVYTEGRIVLVTHAEVIRAVLLHQNGMPLRDWSRLRVEPGTVWSIELVSADRQQEAAAS